MNTVAEAFLNTFKQTLQPPDDFSFPFTPYDIQKEFMTQLYSALEDSKLGIFESPTGTGKSLSLICGALSWLRDHEERLSDELERAISRIASEKPSIQEQNSGDWLSIQIKQAANDNIAHVLRHKMDKINRDKKRLAEIRSRIKDKTYTTSKNRENTSNQITEETDAFEDKPEDCDLVLQDDIEDPSKDNDEDEESNNEDPPVKIIFCSRTHSQLSQFVGEIQRTVFSNTMRVVPMGSRQSCCINKSVKKLKSLSLMNEKCLDMLKSTDKSTKDDSGKVTKKSKGSGCCPHLRNVQPLSEAIISEVMDLEAIVGKGESLSGCPYYATRSAVPDSQIIVVPYNTLLHKSTRESSQLEIKNAVIIIDEAHNLLETVSHIHSSEVSGQQITYALSQLIQYKDKFEKRFSSMNLLHLNQLIYVLKSLIKFIDSRDDTKGDGSETDTSLYTVPHFILSTGIDNYNLFRLVDFCMKNKITHKIRGFTEKYQPTVIPRPKNHPQKVSGMKSFLKEVELNNKTNSKNKKVVEKPAAPPDDAGPAVLEGQPLVPTLAFLSNLTMDYKEGRIVVKREVTLGKSVVKYLLLDPASVMKDLIQNARSVILAGGTMKPFSEFRDRLFLACGADESRIIEFSCGHVIPKDNIMPVIVSSGPSSQILDFSFQKRNASPLIAEVGRLLVNVCTIVPAGIVCFFPSYDYESRVYKFLEEQGFLKKISVRKKVFREPKTSSQVDSVLKEYADCAQKKGGGAIMFSVVGGKLSEGLNFSDDLGRCVVVVGMPYPNIMSPELKEKMSFLNKTVGPQAGREYYENCCMKAVNQCIGRAVRHQNDYSTVLLLDHRYKSPNHIQLLPKWIASSLQIQDKFGPVLGLLGKFFRQRKQ
uniref:DNA 5'-3' helicase n=1 Tax=Lygus hesperus TaxID=30085 RepID=A0A146L2S9_LYGHE